MHTGKLRRTTIWHFDDDTSDLVQLFAQSQAAQPSPSKAIVRFDNDVVLHDIRPTKSYTDSDAHITGACWHRGAHYDYVISGDPFHVARYCDLTAGEREKILLTSRKLSSNNTTAYAVASGTLPKAHETLDSIHASDRLTLRGLVIVEG